MTNDEKILIGSHISLKAPDYFLAGAEQAVSFHESSFMFYTGAPQNTRRLPTSIMKIEEGTSFCKEHGMDLSTIVVHAPYIINLSNSKNPDVYELGKRFLGSELTRVKDFGLSLLVLHPGSTLGASPEEGIETCASAINEVLENDDSGVTICLESMAGKGNELGRSLEEISEIVSRIKKQDRIGVCLDTCHLNDAGYDVSDIDSLVKKFDSLIGLDKLKVIHLNDSKNVMGAEKDRHENIGYGTIGFETLSRWAHEKRFSRIPKILETPMVGEKYPYKKEIEMLVSGKYVDGWREKL
jgi:deoxyribonuclease-4